MDVVANIVDYQYLGKELRKSVISVKPENFKTLPCFKFYFQKNFLE